jgi:hypothetical protein
MRERLEASEAESERKRESNREGKEEREGRREGRRRTTTKKARAQNRAHTHAHTHTHTHPRTHARTTHRHRKAHNAQTKERAQSHRDTRADDLLDSETCANGECANSTRTCRACAARGASKQASIISEARRSCEHRKARNALALFTSLSLTQPLRALERLWRRCLCETSI